MKNLLTSVVLGLALTSAAAAGETTPAKQIKTLPFIKAEAYACAMDDYCFVDPPYRNDELLLLAYRQNNANRKLSPGKLFASTHMLDVRNNAAEHLKGSYDACALAMKFVDRIAAEIPTTKSKLDELIKLGGAELMAHQEKRQAEQTASEAKHKATETKQETAIATEQGNERIRQCMKVVDRVNHQPMTEPQLPEPWQTFARDLGICLPDFDQQDNALKLLALQAALIKATAMAQSARKKLSD